LFLLFSVLYSAGARAAEPMGEPGRSSGKKNPLKNVYFGEQHLHTTISLDAFIMGNRKNTPVDGFNYNKGKPVKKYLTGETLKRRTPYDWTAVTDHAEYMGIFTSLGDKNSPIANDPVVQAFKSNDKNKIDGAFKIIAKIPKALPSANDTRNGVFRMNLQPRSTRSRVRPTSNSPLCGQTRISTPRSTLSTTCVCWRSRRQGGQLMTLRPWVSIRPQVTRPRSRNAHGRRPSGIRPIQRC